MQLSEFSLTTAQMEAGEVFKALETVISEERMQQAIEATQSQAERQRRLPVAACKYNWSGSQSCQFLAHINCNENLLWLTLTATRLKLTATGLQSSILAQVNCN